MTDAEELALLRAENERLTTLVDDSMSFRDLELKMRDGTLDLKVAFGKQGDTGSSITMRWLGAIMWNAILGDDNEEPPNYRSGRMELRLAGETDPLRAYIEIVKPGGKSSHEIRQELEAEVERLKASDQRLSDE